MSPEEESFGILGRAASPVLIVPSGRDRRAKDLPLCRKRLGKHLLALARSLINFFDVFLCQSFRKLGVTRANDLNINQKRGIVQDSHVATGDGFQAAQALC